jgi:hypothetical protein
MNGGLSRRKPENEPPVPRIGVGEPKDVPEERPIGVRIFRIQQYVRSKDHPGLRKKIADLRLLIVD